MSLYLNTIPKHRRKYLSLKNEEKNGDNYVPTDYLNELGSLMQKWP
jgi:hypothetical protein